MPVGVFGAVVLGTTLALVLLSFIDTSPTAKALTGWLATRNKLSAEKPQPEPTPPLTDSERFSIDQARRFWNKRGSGRDAVSRAMVLLGEVGGRLSSRNRMTILLWQPRAELERDRDRVSQAVAEHQVVPLAIVNGLLSALYRTYFDCVRWINECDRQFGVPDECAEQLAEWRTTHSTLLTDLSELSRGAGFGSLKYTLEEERQKEHWS